MSKLELPAAFFRQSVETTQWTNPNDREQVGEYLLRKAFNLVSAKFDKMYAASSFVDVHEGQIYAMVTQPNFDIVQAAKLYPGRDTVWRRLRDGLHLLSLRFSREPGYIPPLSYDELLNLERFAMSAFVDSEMRQGSSFSAAVRRLPTPYGWNWGQRPEFVERMGALMLQGRIINHRLGNTGTLSNNRNATNEIIRRVLS
jgi:hypothetical protein